MTVSGSGTAYIYDGGVASFTTVSAGGTEVVSSGGTVSGTIVRSGGVDDVDALGSAARTTVGSGGYQYVSAGGTESGTVISSGGTEIVYAGGVASGTTVDAGGRLIVVPGATVSGTINDGGTVVSSGVIIVSGGAPTFIGNTFGPDQAVTDGEIEYVESGGLTTATVVSGGAQMLVYSGGVTRTAFDYGQDYLSGGTASKTMVEAGGREYVDSGGVAKFSTVSSGGAQTIYSGGASQSTTLMAGPSPGQGGYEYVSSGGVASGTFVHAYATEMVTSGGAASGTTIVFNGTEYVYSGGSDTGTTISTGGSETVYSGGSATGTVVSKGGSQQLYGTGDLIALNSGGEEYVYSAGVASGTTVSNTASVTVSSGGTASATTVSGGGSAVVTFDGTLVGTILHSGGYEVVSAGGVASGTMMVNGASIYLPYIVYSGGGASVDLSNDQLTVVEGAAIYQQYLSGGYSASVFSAAAFDGGTLVTEIPCFCFGTLIATRDGEVAVEDLSVGDEVRTADGSVRPIAWIGRRVVATDRHPRPDSVCPVHIIKDAFGPGMPRRSLWLSPDHAVYVDRILIPIRYLINDETIFQEPWRTVTYFHVELAEHDILLAEGLPCESFLDTGNKDQFDNGGAALRLHPDFARHIWEAEGYAPLVVHGVRLDAVREFLRRRAAVRHYVTKPAGEPAGADAPDPLTWPADLYWHGAPRSRPRDDG
jgi:autotransporter passenger strand-loop-strand repeat protein